MESKDKILENALDQVIMRALYDMEQSDESAREAADRLSKHYDSLRFDDSLSAEAHERIRQYIENTVEAAKAEFRHIYLQGAKDSVTAMRKLGVIK